MKKQSPLIILLTATLAPLFTGCQSSYDDFNGGIDMAIFKDYPSRCRPDDITKEFPPEGLKTEDLEMHFDTAANYAIGTGSACIHDNILTVWARAQSDQLLWWTGVDSNETTAATKNPDATHSHYYKVLTKRSPIDWDTVFYHTLLNGKLEAPQQIKIDYQMVRNSWEAVLPHWAGAIILQKVSENVTSVIFRAEFKSAEKNETVTAHTGEQIIELYNDLLDSEPNWKRLGVAAPN